MAIESDTFQIPPLIKEIEAKKKIQLKIDCPWPGCYKKGHKTNRAKGCKYYGKTNDDSFVTALEIYLKSEYPDQYGKSPLHDADDFSHPVVPTMLLQIDFIVCFGLQSNRILEHKKAALRSFLPSLRHPGREISSSAKLFL